MHQSIPNANIPRQIPGECFEVVKSPNPGQNFSAKARPLGQETPTPGEYFERSSHLFLLIFMEILQKSNLEKNWKAVQLFFGHTL